MDLVSLLTHHNWANSKYVQYIKSLAPEKYTQSLPGSDKTIHYLTYHLAEVFWYWYGRIHPDHGFEYPEETLNTLQMLDYIERIQSDILDWTKTADISKPMEYRFSETDNMVTTTPENVLQNFIVHSGYHRGQLAFLLRYHGFEGIEETDLNPYIYDLAQ
ncbi:MAG: DinB family protein [Candidatus Kariarchaeaceae archaeon]|jgi:uncharacterized damage-inducible protein DinB